MPKFQKQQSQDSIANEHVQGFDAEKTHGQWK